MMRILMKTPYKKPEMNILEIAPCMILSSSLGISKTSQGDFSEDFAKGHRGAWGNLWEEND